MPTTLTMARDSLEDAPPTRPLVAAHEAIKATLPETLHSHRHASLVAAMDTFSLCLTAEALVP